MTVTMQESRKFQIQEKREYKVIKSNELIQRTRFILTSQEQKIILYLISKIKPEDMELMEQDFQIRDFCDICESEKDSGANYKYIKNSLKNLRDKSIWLKLPNGSETTLSWFSRVTLNENSGTVKIKFDDMMTPHLLHLKEQYTQFSINYVLAMRSLYSPRLYELLKSYENIGSWKFSVEELKSKLYAETYKRYPDFKRKVIDTAVREINSFGDIFVSYQVEKKGNKVTHILFEIRPKTDCLERAYTYANIEDALGKKKTT